MRAYHCAVLLCATTLILVSSAADARHWRHYGYHWHGHGWTGSRSNSDEPQVEKQLPNTQPRNEIRNQGDFSAAIQDMIDACDGQVQELRNMPLDGVARMVNPTEQQRVALEQIRNVTLNASGALASACPKDLPGSVPERLKVLSHALATSLATLRPTFATFYGLLSDEQKARLVAKTASSDDQPRSDEKSRSHTSRDVANRHSASYCQQWVLYPRMFRFRF